MSKHFQEALSRLNPEQRKAVHSIDGPVMVIAGPGTGKTQVMAARIGHILLQTDTQPHNILCLTYTDAATVAMRKRLIEFIGAEAYNIQIYTYHAFCNQVIQDNLHYFGGYRDLQPITELEQVEVMEDIIDHLPKDHPLKRLTGDRYYERGRLSELFSIMKKENWDATWLNQRIDQYIAEIPFNEDFLYKVSSPKRGYKKGDVKENDVRKEIQAMEQLRGGIELCELYNTKLRKLQRYDYHDMIAWVLQAMENHPDLLLDYQERYQYILVDEYQDTNGSQNDLIFKLADYWESPNLFVVGDDDQSIYRFQGASMDNIIEFRNKYEAHLTEVVLTKNYRSTQAILDASRNIITKGTDRLESKFEHISKKLFSQSSKKEVLPRITNFRNQHHEKAFLVQLLNDKLSRRENLSETAVIYRNHAQVAEIIQALEKKGIPIQLRRRMNILEDTWIERLIIILKYLAAEAEKPYSGEHYLPEIMHFSFFKIHPFDVAKIARLCAYKPEDDEGSKRWLDVLHREDQLKSLHLLSYRKVRAFVQNLDKWSTAYYNKTAQVLVDLVLTYSGMLAEMLDGKDKALHMQVLTTFYDLLKEESRRHNNMKMERFISTLEKMKRYGISLPVNKYFQQENGVNFVTAHSSKGLEFRHVIVLGANRKQWEGKRAQNRTYRFPPTIHTGSKETKIEDERRLFFVAMTRAEEQLDIFYSNHDEKRKALEESQFIVELKDENFIENRITDEGRYLGDEEMMAFGVAQLQDGLQKEWEWIDHDVCKVVLEKFRLSVTALNKYLKCPISFYFDSILKVPSARTVFTGFGNAIHLTLEKMHNLFNQNGVYPSADEVVQIYQNKMDHLHSHFTPDEFEDYLTYGEKILRRYVAENKALWPRIPVFKMEYNVPNAVCEDIPIKGRLDRVEVHKDGVVVIDYKTGKVGRGKPKSKPPKSADDPGQDYWRQMVFYKLLIDHDPQQEWRWKNGYFDFIQPDKKTDKLHQVEVDVLPEHEEKVKGQIKTAWKGIQDHHFSQGCGEKDCKWCQFVQYNEIILAPEDDEVDDQEEGMVSPSLFD